MNEPHYHHWSLGRRLAAGAAMGLLLLSGAACSDETGAEQEPTADPGGESSEASEDELLQVDVVLGNNTVVGFHHYYWAQEHGIFEDHGLDVNIVAVDGGEAVAQALATGNADITESPTTSILPQILSNPDFKATMFAVVYTDPLFDLYVPTDSPIEGPADLEGEVIGIGTPDGAEAARAEEVLATAGLVKDTDYTFLAVGDAGPALAAFERGDIAAYAGSVVDAAIAAAQGLDLVSLAPAGMESNSAMGQWITDEAMERLGEGGLRAWVDSMHAVNEQVGSDVSKLISLAQDVRPEEVENEAVATALGERFLAMKEIDGPADSWGSIDPADWERWWARAAQMADVDPGSLTATDYFTNDYTG